MKNENSNNSYSGFMTLIVGLIIAVFYAAIIIIPLVVFFLLSRWLWSKIPNNQKSDVFGTIFLSIVNLFGFTIMVLMAGTFFNGEGINFIGNVEKMMESLTISLLVFVPLGTVIALALHAFTNFFNYDDISQIEVIEDPQNNKLINKEYDDFE